MTDEEVRDLTRCPGPRCAVGGCDFWHMTGRYADPKEPRHPECRVAGLEYADTVTRPTRSEWEMLFGSPTSADAPQKPDVN